MFTAPHKSSFLPALHSFIPHSPSLPPLLYHLPSIPLPLFLPSIPLPHHLLGPVDSSMCSSRCNVHPPERLNVTHRLHSHAISLSNCSIAFHSHTLLLSSCVHSPLTVMPAASRPSSSELGRCTYALFGTDSTWSTTAAPAGIITALWRT